MQVYPLQIRLVDGGLWHRRLVGNGGHHTACGIDFGVDLVPANRPHILDEHICPECHSRVERKTGQMKALARERREFPDVPDSKLVYAPRDEDEGPRRRAPRDTERDDTLRDLPSSDEFLDKPKPDPDR